MFKDNLSFARLVFRFWHITNRLNRSLDEAIEYSIPHLFALGLVGAIGFPLYYWVWTAIYPQAYESIYLRVLGGMLFLGLIAIQRNPNNYQRIIKVYWLLAFIYTLPFFFTFMLLKNECNLVWSMSTMAGLTLLILVAHDWLLVMCLYSIGTTLAVATYTLTTDDVGAIAHYWQQLPVYLFVVLAGSFFNYKSSRVRQEKLKILASVGAELAHELRTPLLNIKREANAILNADEARFAPETTIDDKSVINQDVNTFELKATAILDELEHTNTVIEMLLVGLGNDQISRDKLSLHDMRTVIDKAVGRYPFSSDQEKSKIHTEESKGFLFLGSDILMLHVLFNLIKNALRFTEHDGVISITCQPGLHHNRVIVKNTGKGISLKQQALIFDVFFTSAKAGKGFGIGLPFSQKVMARFGGAIHCDSRINEYTAFTLSFPVVSEQALNTHQQNLTHKAFAHLGKQRILWLDDEPEFGHKLRARLPENNLDITVAGTTVQALSRLNTEPFDILVTHLRLLTMDHFAFIQQIRSSNGRGGEQCGHPSLPILIFGDEAEATPANKAMLGNATFFLNKSCSPIDFVDSLQQSLKSSAEQALIQQMTTGLSGITAMVVDDHDVNRSQLRELLHPYGVRVLEAIDGSTAMQQLDQHDCDIVLTDLHMPGLDGWALANQIRTREARDTQWQNRGDRIHGLPIVAITGDPRQAIEARCLQVGMQGVVSKPVELISLLKAIQSCMAAVKHSSLGPAPRMAVDANSPPTSAEDAISQLLHDVLTPLLSIEVCSELLQDHLPTLLTAYQQSLNQNAIPTRQQHALKASADNFNQIVGYIRHNIDRLWQQVKDAQGHSTSTLTPTQHSAKLTSICEPLINNFVHSWQQIAQIQQTHIAPAWPLLLECYRPNQQSRAVELEITHDHWSRLTTLSSDCKAAVDQVMSCIQGYEKFDCRDR